MVSGAPTGKRYIQRYASSIDLYSQKNRTFRLFVESEMMFQFLLLLDCKRETSKLFKKKILIIRLHVSCAPVKTGTEENLMLKHIQFMRLTNIDKSVGYMHLVLDNN